MALSRRRFFAGALASPAAAAQLLPLPRKLRLAMVGLEGHTGEVLNPLKTIPDIEITAMYDPRPEAMKRLARNPLAAKARQYSDPAKLLETEELDLAVVCGDNGSRPGLILAAARRKLHIVAEKPLAVDVADFRRVQRAVADNRVKLTMLLPMRFYPVFTEMRRLVQAGDIGDVAQMGAQKSYKLGERSEWMRHRKTFGGTIPYIGIHMVDLMRFTSGRELVEAASFQARIGFPEMLEMENTTATIFRLDNGGTAALRMDYLRPQTAPSHGDDRLRLAGTKGVLEHQAATGLTLVTDKEKPRVVKELPPPRSLFVDFLNHVYHGQPSGLTHEEIWRANEIVFAAREAAVRHQIVKT